jgi:hypothetical protein
MLFSLQDNSNYWQDSFPQQVTIREMDIGKSIAIPLAVYASSVMPLINCNYKAGNVIQATSMYLFRGMTALPSFGCP